MLAISAARKVLLGGHLRPELRRSWNYGDVTLTQLAQLGLKRVSRFVAAALIDQGLGMRGRPDLGV